MLDIISAIQMASGTIVSANLSEADHLINSAVSAGAKLVVLPENFGLMAVAGEDKLEHVEVEGHGPMQEMLSMAAAKHKVWVVGGTIPVQSDDPEKPFQTCFVYDSSGQQVARYNKIHLFDVSIDAGQEVHAETQTTTAGKTVVVIDSPFGRLGISIGYDLRFPEIYRAMLDQGMEIAAIPSAFTKQTGFAHWEVLLRARAIENSAYIIAAAQGGFHVSGRETYGHSMIVNPCGTIITKDLPSGSGHVISTIDQNAQTLLRDNFPCLDHRVIKTCQ